MTDNQSSSLHSTEEEHLELLIKNNPFFQAIVQQCKEADERCYIGGGTIRDVLRSKVPTDIDLFFELSREQLKQIVERAKTKINEPMTADHGLDMSCIQDIAQYISQFDFTVNALAWDATTKRLIDPSGRGLQDLRNQELHPINNALFLSAPRSHMRLFRLAFSKDLTIPEETCELLKENSSLILTANEDDRCILFGELLDIMRIESPYKMLKLMKELGTLERVLPEISTLMNDTNWLATLEQQWIALDDQLNALNETIREKIIEPRKELLTFPKTSNRNRAVFQWNHRSLLRMTLCLNLGFEAITKLDTTSTLQESAQREAARRNFFMNFASRYQSQPRLKDLALCYSEITDVTGINAFLKI